VNGGSFAFVVSGAIGNGAAIYYGGTEFVEFAGLDQNDFVYGTQVVSQAFTLEVTVKAGGRQVLDSGGTAVESFVASGGSVFVEYGGSAVVLVDKGGDDYLYGGQAEGTYISSGGTEYVESGGLASHSYVFSGGTQVVESGGAAVSTSIYSGGTMEIASGGLIGSAPVTFASSDGTLQLDDSENFSGQIQGFDSHPGNSGDTNYLDLRDILYGPSTNVSFVEANNSESGTLTVTDGTHTANLVLLGDYATGDFQKKSDGFGGTEIYDPANSAQLGTVVTPTHT
jgi:autotransporter passenger strand-loop-strand repeat protein